MATVTIRGEYLGKDKGKYNKEDKKGNETGELADYHNFKVAVVGGIHKFKAKNVTGEMWETLPAQPGGMCEVEVEIIPNKIEACDFGRVKRVSFKSVDATNAVTQDRTPVGAGR